MKKEILVLLIMLTEEAGGVAELSFDPEGRVFFDSWCEEGDLGYDNVSAGLIIAEIENSKVVSGKVVHTFVVVSYEAGEKPRALLNGDSHVSMSKTEKMVYKMVKCNIKETQRRHDSRKRARATKEMQEKT